MIYSIDIKKDPKGFIIKSFKSHIFLNGKIYKLIKYKEYLNNVHIFYKRNNKVYQIYISRDFFNNWSAHPSIIFKKILAKSNMLLYRYYKKVAKRYFKRYYPEEYKNLISF